MVFVRLFVLFCFHSKTILAKVFFSKSKYLVIFNLLDLN